MIPKKMLTTISLEDTIGDTIHIIDEKNLLSLPVVDNNQFKGIISKKYIYEEYFFTGGDKNTFLQRKVSEFMKTTIETIEQTDMIERAAQILTKKNLQFIPVEDENGEFCGIVTHKAIFEVLNKALGFGHTRIVLTTHEGKGRLAKLADVIAKRGANIISITGIDMEVMDLRELILRVDTKDVKKLVQDLELNGFTVRQVNEG